MTQANTLSKYPDDAEPGTQRAIADLRRTTRLRPKPYGRRGRRAMPAVRPGHAVATKIAEEALLAM